MAAVAVMNGLIIWIFAIINWFRRTIYHFRNAVSVYGRPAAAEESKGSWTFTFDYNGQTQNVFVYEPSGRVDLDHLLNEKGKAELLWIPGKKHAMLMQYHNNSKLLACDIGSIAALILMILSFVLVSQLKGSEANTASYFALFFAASMIALAIIRRQCRMEETERPDRVGTDRDEQTTVLENTAYTVKLRLICSGQYMDTSVRLREGEKTAIGSGNSAQIRTNPADTGISERHGIFAVSGGTVIYTDCSRGGSRYNGQRILHQGGSIALPFNTKSQIEMGKHKVLVIVGRT